jgi:hypothetical protein
MIALVLVAAHSQTHPPPAAAQSQLVWVRQDPPVINQRNDPTFWECPEGVHCEGSFWDYIVDETEIIKEERYVNNGHEYYHIIVKSQFDRPPQVINPGSRYKVRASFSHSWVSGTPTYRECLYFQYHSLSRPWLAEPPWEFAYCPWADSFDGTASAEWMLDPGWPFKEGDTFQITADWIFDDPANVTWTYRAEPATPADETRLGAEVIAPVVSYQGEEVAPEETFFPGTCDFPLNRSSEPCANTIELEERAKLNLKCVRLDKLGRLMLIVELLDLEKIPAAVWAKYYKLARDCEQTSARADDDFGLGLYLEQGGLLLTNTIAGQTVDVATPLATATTTRPGAFVAGFNPATQAATFRAFSVPLTVRPNTGAPLILEPYEGVELTADGFGPVDELPHIFLPLQIR